MPGGVQKTSPMSLAWDGAMVHFAEIGLKGKNRGDFIRMLADNIRKVVSAEDIKVHEHRDRILVTFGKRPLSNVISPIAAVCGVAFVTPVREVPADIDGMSRGAIELYSELAWPDATYGVSAKRNCKTFPLTSPEIGRQVGFAVGAATGAPVNLNAPDIPIHFRIYDNKVYLEGPRVAGPGGMPVGVSGRVMCLFSGGIDSPAAAWLMMKRGCAVDFIHFHVYGDPEQVRESKIIGMIQAITKPQGQVSRLHLVPYTAFESGMMQARIPQELELVLFRRFMARTAARLAVRNRCHAIVTGDNLAQVASQTMHNLIAFDDASDISVFRPLLTFNKQEIIDLSQKLGTFELSLEKYKDCCSLVAKHPHTSPRLETVRHAESGLPVDDMTDSAIAEAVCWTLAKGSNAKY